MARTWRLLVGVGLGLTLGCSQLLNLDALEKSDCEDECGRAAASAGTNSQGGDTAGTSPGGSSSAAGSSSGASAPSVGGRESGGGSAGAGSVNGDGGALGGGTGGGSGSGGAQPVAGGATGGGAGGPGVAGCTPSATDQSCDGLDESCHETAADAACTSNCEGAFVNGTSYMSCFALSGFDQAEAVCQANGMQLVKIDSALEDEAVFWLALDDYVWIGGTNRADLHVFNWLDGSPFYDFEGEITGTYQNFSASEPDWDERWRCVEQDPDGTWSTWDCLDGQSFVCERY